MPFNQSQTMDDDGLELTDLIDEDGDKNPLDIAEAVFSDGSRLEFPAGCRFPADNHVAAGKVTQQRVRIIPPKTSQGPSLLMPMHCSKTYVRTLIKRIEKGV